MRCLRLQSSKINVSTFDDRCVDFRRSMCRLSKIDDRCVDLRRSTIDVSTFEDRSVDLRRSMCRPSKIDGRCEIMLLYLLKNIDTIVVCELRRGFVLQCFHCGTATAIISFSWKQTPQNIGSSSFSFFLHSNTYTWEVF